MPREASHLDSPYFELPFVGDVGLGCTGPPGAELGSWDSAGPELGFTALGGMNPLGAGTEPPGVWLGGA
jgi:hypothetical protein